MFKNSSITSFIIFLIYVTYIAPLSTIRFGFPIPGFPPPAPPPPPPSPPLPSYPGHGHQPGYVCCNYYPEQEHNHGHGSGYGSGYGPGYGPGYGHGHGHGHGHEHGYGHGHGYGSVGNPGFNFPSLKPPTYGHTPQGGISNAMSQTIQTGGTYGAQSSALSFNLG